MDIASQIRRTLRNHAGQLESLAVRIHETPELGMQEKQACAWQIQLLRQWGFRVQSPFAGLPTAFKAVRGVGRPAFCFMSEYDALPQIGHACGHNLIAATALGAGLALAETLAKDRQPGTVVVMGTPAEEGHGGKVQMVRRGALKGIDAAMMAHPSSRTTPDIGRTAIVRFDVTFHGHAAHAAAAPEKGVNALDAALFLFQGVNAWRQHLPETCRVHGIIREGGVAPNIVPDRATCVFYLRSPEDAFLPGMAARFRQIVQGASRMAGTRFTMSPFLEPYKAGRLNNALNQAFCQAAEAAGLKPRAPERSGRGSSDFGDVSIKIPGAHIYFAISTQDIAGHSPEMRDAAGSPYGRRQMLRAAEALAVVGLRFLTDPAFRNDVKTCFRETP